MEESEDSQARGWMGKTLDSYKKSGEFFSTYSFSDDYEFSSTYPSPYDFDVG
jgi:hypothetical protein